MPIKHNKSKVNVLVIAVASPMLIGIYANHQLLEQFECTGQTLQELPDTFVKILQQYDIEKLYYTKGPGQAMAVKIAFVFLKSFALVRKLPFYACLAFEFNEFSPIKAFGKHYFIYQKDNKNNFKSSILDQIDNKAFVLPQKLDHHIFDGNTDLLFDKL